VPLIERESYILPNLKLLSGKLPNEKLLISMEYYCLILCELTIYYGKLLSGKLLNGKLLNSMEYYVTWS